MPPKGKVLLNFTKGRMDLFEHLERMAIKNCRSRSAQALFLLSKALKEDLARHECIEKGLIEDEKDK